MDWSKYPPDSNLWYAAALCMAAMLCSVIVAIWTWEIFPWVKIFLIGSILFTVISYLANRHDKMIAERKERS